MTSPDGLYDWLALAAAALAPVAVLLLAWNAVALRRVRRDQKVVLGGQQQRDVIAHAAALQREFLALRDWIDESGEAIDKRMQAAEQRLSASVSHTAMLRYDAYGELTGRQSSSMALVDDNGDGLVISAIRHRSHSHLYVKQLRGRESDIDLSPEEREVIARAFSEHPVPPPPVQVPEQPPRGQGTGLAPPGENGDAPRAQRITEPAAGTPAAAPPNAGAGQ